MRAYPNFKKADTNFVESDAVEAARNFHIRHGLETANDFGPAVSVAPAATADKPRAFTV